jgi:small nuclear ribonucleoprotein (snRNP)-like protein
VGCRPRATQPTDDAGGQASSSSGRLARLTASPPSSGELPPLFLVCLRACSSPCRFWARSPPPPGCATRTRFVESADGSSPSPPLYRSITKAASPPLRSPEQPAFPAPLLTPPSGRPLTIPPRYSRCCASPTSVASTLTGSMTSPPPYMSFTSPAALVTVCALLHDGQLIRGMFVSFDPAWNPILQDCVELHPQVGRHVPGSLVFPRSVIASLAVEPVSSPPFLVPLSGQLLWLSPLTPYLRRRHLPLPPPIWWSTLAPPSTLLLLLARYLTPIFHIPHTLILSSWATVPLFRSPPSVHRFFRDHSTLMTFLLLLV